MHTDTTLTDGKKMSHDELKKLHIIHYPDPRLRQISQRVEEFDGQLAALVERMFELMQTGDGVGLAAPQIGINKRLFVMNTSGEPHGRQVFVNPTLHDLHGSAESQEGCLSLPGVNVQVRRALTCRLTAQDLQGRPVELLLEGLPARVCQHETDHLNGVLIIDRMGPGDRIATRKTLKALEDQYRAGHERRRARSTAAR